MVVSDKVVVELQAKLDKYNSNILKAQTGFERAMGRIQMSATGAERRVSSSSASMAASLTRAFAVAGGVRSLQVLLDSATKIDNALKVTGLRGEELERVYNRLRESALRNRAPVETLAQLYSRLGLAQSQLGVSNEDMLQFTDRVALALRVQGTTAQEARGALIQLSQAMGAGIVRAEEFNSIVEGAPSILRAAAAGLKEAGGSVAQLRQLVIDGKVSSQAFFQAFMSGAPMLENMVEGAQITVSQGMENIRTALIDAMREFANGSMAAESLGDAFGVMADKINSIDFEAFGQQARELVGWINQIGEAMRFLQGFSGRLGAALGESLGTDAFGDWVTGGSAQKSFLGGAITIENQRGIQRRIDQAFAGAVETAAGLTEEAVRKAAGNRTTDTTGRVPSNVVTPVSLGDFASPDGAGGKKGGRKGAGSRENEYERLSKRIRESTEALNAETLALSNINPLVNDYGFALEKARTEQELLTAANQAGIKITPELRESIDALATSYANAEVNASKLKEQQDQIVEAADFVKESLGGMVMDMIPAIETGNDALNRFLNTLLEAVAQATLLGTGPLAAIFGGGGSGLLGGLFGGFRANGGPVNAGRAYIVGERGPEMIIPRSSGMVIPAAPTAAAMAGGGGGGVVINVPINAPGADAAQLARVEAAVQELGKSIPKMVDQRTNTRQVRGTRA